MDLWFHIRENAHDISSKNLTSAFSLIRYFLPALKHGSFPDRQSCLTRYSVKPSTRCAASLIVSSFIFVALLFWFIKIPFLLRYFDVFRSFCNYFIIKSNSKTYVAYLGFWAKKWLFPNMRKAVCVMSYFYYKN